MKGLEESLGFRVSGPPNGRKVELLSREGDEVKAVRPATPQEADLWQALLGQEEGMRVAGDSVQRWMHEATQARADVNSLKSSCEAYRQELEKLRVYAEANYPRPGMVTEQNTTLELFSGIVQSHNRQKQRLLDKAREIWEIPPGTDIFEFMFRQLQHITGELAAETDQRRAEYVSRIRPANSEAMYEHLAETQGKTAGRPVRDAPQA